MSIVEETIDLKKLQWFYGKADPLNDNGKPPVLLLHGIPAQSFGWTALMPDIAEAGFRVIAPDWIGFGGSAKPDKRQFAYTPDAYIEALGELVDALELDKFSLVVQGFLGSVGLQYALRHPERIERLAILNAPVSSVVKLPWRIKQLGLPFVGDMMTQDPLLMDRTLEKGSGYTVSDEDLDVYRRPFLKSSDAGRALLAAIRNLKLSEAMAEIESGYSQWTHPTLVMWGTKDPWLPLEDAEKFTQMLENGSLVKLPDAGHFPQEHWSAEISKSLVPFLRREMAE